MTDMGYEDPSYGNQHPGWVICNQSTKEGSEYTYDLSEVYLCNNNDPNNYFLYPSSENKKGMLTPDEVYFIREEDRYKRYKRETNEFLDKKNYALWQSKCGQQCTNSPYPTY
jgi:hypothetical protein